MDYISNVRLKLFDKVLLGIVVFIFLIYCVCTFWLGSATFVDVLRGYVSMEQFLNGEKFNTLNYQLASEKVSYFVAWWTPGQYILPYGLKSFGMSLQTAQSILICSFLGVSLIGYLRLFRFFSFSPTISLLSILLILTNHLFFWNSLMYFGGSLFELALLPWFLVFLLKIESFSIKTGLIYFVLALVLFFLKATFLIHVGIGLGVLLLGYKAFQKKELVIIVLTGLSILAVCYFSFLQFGETPSSAVDNGMYNSIPNNVWNDLFTPFASIVGIPFAVGTFVQKMLPYYSWIGYIGYGIMTLLSLYSFYLFRKISKVTSKHQRLVLFASLFLTLFIIFFLTNRAISYDFRHFTPLAFVFVPFVLKELRRNDKSGKLLNVLVFVLVVLNLLFYTLKRGSVPGSMKEMDGIYYPNNRFNSLSYMIFNDDKVPTKPTVFLIGTWNLEPIWTGKNVIPVVLKNGEWFLNSGIELDQTRKIDFSKEIAKSEMCTIYGLGQYRDEILKIVDEDEFDIISDAGLNFVLIRR